MNRFSTFLVLSALLAASAVHPASAQSVCADRGDIVKRLAGKYSETPTSIGLANSGGIVELLTSADGNTWTLIVTDTQGVSCLMAAGQYWEQAPKVAANAGSRI